MLQVRPKNSTNDNLRNDFLVPMSFESCMTPLNQISHLCIVFFSQTLPQILFSLLTYLEVITSLKIFTSSNNQLNLEMHRPDRIPHLKLLGF